MKLRTGDRITQKYLRRWPDSERARLWAGRLVHISTDNGVWRVNGQGYTYADQPDAWVLPFEEAQKHVAHCGPEKRAAFILAAVYDGPAFADMPEDVKAAARTFADQVTFGGYEQNAILFARAILADRAGRTALTESNR